MRISSNLNTTSIRFLSYTYTVLRRVRPQAYFNIEDMCYMSAYTSSEICTSLNAVTGLGLDKKYYQPKELNKKILK
jgi:hypothetical protein